MAFINEVFKRTFGGESELLFISGDAGVGKTAVINEIRKNIAAGKVYFVSGKFEQYKRDIPYEPIIKGLQNLIKQLLTETDEELKKWKEIILEKVGKNGKIISEVIPEIELIIGVQPEYEKIGQLENQTRIGNLFSQFANAFSTPERPFVIIMDDIQWVDRPSLLLLENFILNNENRNTFIIGSYRDKEVDEGHILYELMNRLHKNFRKYEMLKIEPLEERVVDELVQDIFKGIEKDKAKELSYICRKKTAGNPFFLRQFMKYLSDNEFFYYNKSKKRWDILIDKIKRADITDNVVEFILGKIKRLNPKTINVLKLASCIGNTFDLKTLSLIAEKEIAEVEEDIKEAIEKEFIVKNENTKDEPENYSFKFIHDRVQQAAYMMIEEEQRNELHYKIGMLIYRGIHNVQDRCSTYYTT